MDPIFEPLRFRNLTVKNRLFRSNFSGRFDYYSGAGSQARINFEERFARGGVGAILSSHAPVHIRGRILPNYATIDRDERIPFWRRLGEKVHEHDCVYILQLSHGGRQRDIPGVENDNNRGLSATSRTDPLHGFLCQAMTRAEIAEVTGHFAAAARRARLAGLDGVELHACNGYQITQFLSSAINDRKDEYGGSLENRARFLLDIVGAIRREAGDDFHLQVKISAVDHNNAVAFWEKKGNTLDESIQVCKWLEAAGVDVLHISTGSAFPHPRNPAGDFPLDDALRVYDTMLSSGVHTFRFYLILRFRWLHPLFNLLWYRTRRDPIEGISAGDARAIRNQVGIPVLCTGGFQTASFIRKMLEDGFCDGVSMARALLANPELPRMFADGMDLPPKPCTYCNKCLMHVVEDPFGCYDLSRYDGDYERMMQEIMSVFEPSLEAQGET